MPNRTGYSLISIAIVMLVALVVRFSYWENNTVNGYNATSWDAFGYYMYQPSFLIYGDAKHLDWLPEIDAKYQVTGGELYQARKLPEGTYVFKYLVGVSLLQVPFFYVGHAIAQLTDAPQDGFSWPYQYAIMLGALFWFLIGLLFLRKVLLNYFSDAITGLTLLFLFLATNLPQYISIDGAMSHSWIFPLYCFVLWLTDKWHKKPSWQTAFLIGLISGIAIISRPTELIILFIPLLWGCQTKALSKQKWKLVKRHLPHVYLGVFGVVLGVLPQLLYWFYATGELVYDVGSKWNFLTPWFRIVFGFHSGWFIYTPITIIFIIGLWFMENQPFKKSIIVFCVLNLWIIMAWSDWKYGVSYAGRALSQGSPVYAFALAAFLSNQFHGKRRILIVVISVLLIVINFYQIEIYNSGIYSNFSLLEKLVKGF